MVRKSKSISVKNTKAPKKSGTKKTAKVVRTKTKNGGSPVVAIPALLKSSKFLQAAPALINTVGILGTKGELQKILSRASEKKIAERSMNYANNLRKSVLHKAKPVIENRIGIVKNRGNVFMNNINKVLGNRQVLEKVSGLVSMAQNFKNNLSSAPVSQLEQRQREVAEILKQRSRQAQILEQQKQQALLLEQQQAKVLERQRQVVEILKQRSRQAQILEQQKRALEQKRQEEAALSEQQTREIEAQKIEQKKQEEMLLEQQNRQAKEIETQRMESERLRQAEITEQQFQKSQSLEMEKLILIEFLKELRKTKMSMVKIEKALIEMKQTGATPTLNDKQAICQIYSEISDKVRSQCNQPFINNPQACIERTRVRFGINENTKRKALEIVSDTC
jgi:hypothetical protein